MFPFFYVIAILVLASWYSQFWEQYPSFFLIGIGMLITHMTGNLNLNSCCLQKYNPFYVDPFVFCAILYCDSNRLLDPGLLAGLYIALVAQRSLQYFLFMRGTINQLCEHLDIPFLETKQVFLARRKAEESKKSK